LKPSGVTVSGVLVAVDVDLALDGRGKLRGHGRAAWAFSSGEAASVCLSPTDFGNESATRAGLVAEAATVALALRVTPSNVASMR
jgi:hypothetical protein